MIGCKARLFISCSSYSSINALITSIDGRSLLFFVMEHIDCFFDFLFMEGVEEDDVLL